MKKSQAALEFLTTYAWAFIVITVTIGALYYFGIFDFSKYLPQKCVFPSQFKCLDFSLKPTEVRFKLVNNLGEDICVKSMQITNDATPPISCTPNAQPQGSCGASEFQWVHATEKDLSFATCTGGAYVADTRVELRVSLSYYAVNTPSRPIHSINGRINGKVTSS
ncbi:hypothetical protein HYX00_02550 [Candidatus Woesearchaeota archaeon]|nr:hypothetical protein [Candidatus Woesearchaeota archaeon]